MPRMTEIPSDGRNRPTRYFGLRRLTLKPMLARAIPTPTTCIPLASNDRFRLDSWSKKMQR
ncbi:hypothetical protein D3C76_1616120 [compost metagenome]